ncbi:MAG: polyprenyl synthetase family protein [Oscillospiraceae bacterium]|nr:polyprenyl synthetase family protein [Oscillospiraceae bacterium]
MNSKKLAEDYRQEIDAALEQYFQIPAEWPQAGLGEAMRYSLLAGGKRIRPMLVLEFCRIAGGDREAAMPVACAIEMMHTYSLIHDDLPCMDNDFLRRGKPTNHVVYGECTATLAGDTLQAEAFGTILRSDLPIERKAACAEILAGAVGIDGMCCGQYLDMLWEGKTLSEQELSEINSRKTGALLVAACQMGVAAAGGTEKELEAAGQFGAALGLAFQIRDDMLDVLSTEEKLGKPIGSDAQENKNTYMVLKGKEGCEKTIARLTEFAKSVLNEAFSDTDFLSDLAYALASREK